MADLFTGQDGEEDLKKIGDHVKSTYEQDKSSRGRWEKNMEDAEELALQITQEKTYPWPKAANVKFPLITIASMQFAARAYPALVKAPNLVKYRVQGKDDGSKAARASRIGAHMSWQFLEQDEPWEENMDKALLALPILGCVFKKSYFDTVKGHNCSKTVLPKNLIVHYYARSIEECERKTEIFQLSPREIKERQLRKVFSNIDLPSAPLPDANNEDERQGLSAPADSRDRARTLLEQHCYLDLDGDGYKEPYVVTVSKDTAEVYRIVHRFGKITTEQSLEIENLQQRIKALAEGLPPEASTPQELAMIQSAEQTIMGMQEKVQDLASEKPKVLKIDAVEYYTKYSFIPSPDGGFYDLGFGALLGPLNDSVNTLINQLLDAGSLQNGNMGFLGKGARIKGGKIRFSPNEWKRVNVAGSTLRDSLVPLPVNQPSPVLFNLLSLLITYAERVGSVTDAMMGDNPGQNTPAYNMSAMLEQGLQVFNGIFKRVYRSMRSEFRKCYSLNAIYLDQEEYFSFQDGDVTVLRADYNADPKDLIPAADPNAFSNKEKMQKAAIVAERSQMVPGYDPTVVELRLLEASDVPDVNEVFPRIPELDENGEETGNMVLKFPPQPDPEMEIKKADMQRRTLEGKTRSEVTMVEAEAKLMVAEADVVLKMTQAKKLGDDTELKRFEIILEELQDKRKSLVEIAKIEESAKQRADSGVAGKSGS